MSAVVEAIEAQHATARVERITQDAASQDANLHWRYDLLGSARFPVQYYAVALRGSGPDAEEALVIAIECFDSINGEQERLVVSASITQEGGVVLAEGPEIEIPLPAVAILLEHPERLVNIIEAVQAAFDEMVDWVNSQRSTIERALA